MTSVIFAHDPPSSPVPEDEVEVITTRRQELTTEGEVDTVDAALVTLQLPLKGQPPDKGFARVVGLFECGESLERIKRELAGVEVVERVGGGLVELVKAVRGGGVTMVEGLGGGDVRVVEGVGGGVTEVVGCGFSDIVAHLDGNVHFKAVYAQTEGSAIY